MNRVWGGIFIGIFLSQGPSALAETSPHCPEVLKFLYQGQPLEKPAKPEKTNAPTFPLLRALPAEQKRLHEFLASTPGEGSRSGLKPPTTEELIRRAQSELSPEEAKAFSDWLLGQFFEDPLVGFEDHFLGRQKQLYASGPTRYNRNGERPFDGYLAARDYLKRIPLSEIGLSQIQEAHKKLMSRESSREDSGKIFQTDKVPARNSQGLKDSELGQIRSESVGFELNGKYVPSEINGIGHTVPELEAQNLYLKKSKNETLSYAPLVRWRTIDAKKPLSNALVTKLQELEKKHGIQGLRNLEIPEIAQAQKEFLTELTERLWRETLSDVEKAKTHEQIIKAAARFQQELISIHPFIDGNGRVSRLLTEKLLESKGLPAPLYTHWGEDVALAPGQLEAQLARGVLLSQDYHEALASHLSKGESFESVPNPILAIRAKELLGGPQENFDSQAFLKWVSAHRESLGSFSESVRAFQASDSATAPLPELSQQDKEMIVGTLGGYLKHFSPGEFQLWRQNQTNLPNTLKGQVDQYMIWLHHLISSDSERAIRLVPTVFQKSFAQLSASQEEYQKKMDQFYGTHLLYRGTPSDRYLSDKEVVELMAKPSPFTTGNGVPLSENPDSRFAVFQDFNQQLLQGGDHLSSQTHAHVEGTSDPYFRSGMVSFSDQEGIGRNWQFSSTNNVGILIMAREREPGVVHTGKTTSRLGQLGYAHEREQALVGGADPESITAIEVKQQAADPKDGSPRRTKKAKRINFNTIEITEVIFEKNPSSWSNDVEIPKVGKPRLWRILPDGNMVPLDATE